MTLKHCATSACALMLCFGLASTALTAPANKANKNTLEVTINQAKSQLDPALTAPIDFDVSFSSEVSDFEPGDIDFTGSTVAGDLIPTINGKGKKYTVSVFGVTSTGTVVASIPAGAVVDEAGNPNQDSTSTDNSVTISGDEIPPQVTIEQGSTQPDPTEESAIIFDVTFSEPVVDFTNTVVVVSGTAGPTTATVSGSGAVYTIVISGMTTSGTVTALIPAGVVVDMAGNQNQASSSTDNTVLYLGDVTPPEVTIEQGSTQSDPTEQAMIVFDVTFSEPVQEFTNTDIDLSGTAGATTATITGSGAVYYVEVGGMTNTGTVEASIPANVVTDMAGNQNLASSSIDNTVTFNGDFVPPQVTIEQGSTQPDPTSNSTIIFDVTFSEAVTDFTGADVQLEGSALPTTATVTGSGSTYIVEVGGMRFIYGGIVMASIPAGVAFDAAGNPNQASTSIDNYVTYQGDMTPPQVTINQASGQMDPTTNSLVYFDVTFSETVGGLRDYYVSLTLGGSLVVDRVSVADGGIQSNSYSVAVYTSGVGLLQADIPAGVTVDAAGNGNLASTSIDNTVLIDGFPPTVVIEQAPLQPDPTNVSPIQFEVTFSEPVTGFEADDVMLTSTGSAFVTNVIVSGSGANHIVNVEVVGDGSVIASIPAGAAVDAAGNRNQASTSIDNTVLIDRTGPTVTIDQATSQPDPTNVSPIQFEVTFSEPVIGFTGEDVELIPTGSAIVTNVIVGGFLANYIVEVSVEGAGSVGASIPANVVTDAAGNPNQVSTSSDDTITYSPSLE